MRRFCGISGKRGQQKVILTGKEVQLLAELLQGAAMLSAVENRRAKTHRAPLRKTFRRNRRKRQLQEPSDEGKVPLMKENQQKSLKIYKMHSKNKIQKLNVGQKFKFFKPQYLSTASKVILLLSVEASVHMSGTNASNCLSC